MKSLEILWHKACFSQFIYILGLFQRLGIIYKLKKAFGTTAAATFSALLSPLAKDGWFMSAVSSSLLVNYEITIRNIPVIQVFTLTWALSKGYYHNILYESKAAKWQRELEMKNLQTKNNIEGLSS